MPLDMASSSADFGTILRCTSPGLALLCVQAGTIHAATQEAEGKVKQEETTVPGEAPGIYACDYKKLAQIHLAVAQGRVALLQGNLTGAEVSVLCPCPPGGPACRLPAAASALLVQEGPLKHLCLALHFLWCWLGLAWLAVLAAPAGSATPQDWRHAMHAGHDAGSASSGRLLLCPYRPCKHCQGCVLMRAMREL